MIQQVRTAAGSGIMGHFRAERLANSPKDVMRTTAPRLSPVWMKSTSGPVLAHRAGPEPS
jgi:hypothetical protein